MTTPVAPSPGQPRAPVGQGNALAASRLAQAQVMRGLGGEATSAEEPEAPGVLRQPAAPGPTEVTYRPGMAAAETMALAAAIAPAVGHAKADGLLALDPRTAAASSIAPTPRESPGRRLRVAPVDPVGQSGGTRWLRWGVAAIAVVALIALVSGLVR